MLEEYTKLSGEERKKKRIHLTQKAKTSPAARRVVNVLQKLDQRKWTLVDAQVRIIITTHRSSLNSHISYQVPAGDGKANFTKGIDLLALTEHNTFIALELKTKYT